MKILAQKKKNYITGSNNWNDVAINNWCRLQWSLEVKTCLVLWKVFKGYNFWIRIWLTSNLSWETIFPLLSRSILLTGNTKSTVGSISVQTLIYFGYLFLMSNFHTLYHITIFFKRLIDSKQFYSILLV